METQVPPTVSLEAVIAPWPIASSLSSHIGAGDLISLARSNTGLRAVLHGFEKPMPTEIAHNQELGVVRVSTRTVRHSLNIGFHDTLYWQRLKEEARFTCSSPTHTRGDKCHSCRRCSKPICEACIVRSSFQRGKENTFNNRVRYFCAGCWDKGSVSKSRRYPLASTRRHSEWYSSSRTGEDHCTCTLKDDGWLCLECKDHQNYEAATTAVKNCHGEDCENSVGANHERRRTCLWCQKTLPSPFGGASRHMWTQQMIDAKQRSIEALAADIGEYNRTRLTTMRMTRRELRGEDVVRDDPEADMPQYVRHLDTVNYEHYMEHDAAPSGQEVYDSKRGFWRYNKQFLLSTHRKCRYIARKGDLSYILEAASEYARTNGQKLAEFRAYQRLQDIENRVYEDFSDVQKKKFDIACDVPNNRKTLPHVFASNLWHSGTKASSKRVEEWHSLKAHILDVLFTQKLGMLQAQVHLWHTYNFWADRAEFEIVLTVWGHDFDSIKQPILPPTLPERDVLKLEERKSDDFLVEELKDYYDEDHLRGFYEELDKAETRMAGIERFLDPPPAEGESDDGISDDIDQATLFKMIRSEYPTGKSTDLAEIAARYHDEEDEAYDSGEDRRESSSSAKQKDLPAEGGGTSSYLQEMDGKLMGALAQYARPKKQKREEDVGAASDPVLSATKTSRSD